MSRVYFEARNGRARFFDFLLTAIAVGFYFVVSAIFSWRSLDLTDEGLYILSTYFPNQFFHSLFGFPLHWLLEFFDGNLGQFRFAGYVILLFANFLLVDSLLQLLENDKKRPLVTLNLAVLAASFYVFLGVATPSYNWLSLVGLSVAAGFLLRSLGKSTLKAYFFVLLASLGVALSIFGKFSSPIIFLLGVGLTSLLLHYFSLAGRAIATGGLGFAWSSFIYSDGLDRSLINDLISGARIVREFDSTYEFFQSIAKFVETLAQLGAVAGVLAATIALASRGIGLSKKPGAQVTLVSLSLVCFIAGVSMFPSLRFPILGGTVLTAIFLVLPSLIARFFRREGGDDEHTRTEILAASTGLSIAFGVGVGGNNGAILLGLYLGAVAVICLVIYLRRLESGGRLFLPIFAMFTSCVLLFSAIANPYRQSPLTEERAKLDIGESTLWLEPELTWQVAQLQNCIDKSGLGGMTLLDLTKDMSTGMIFLLELKPPKRILPTVWGYNKSANLFEATLSDLDHKGTLVLLKRQDEDSLALLSLLEEHHLSRGISYVLACSTDEWEILSPLISGSTE